MLWHLPNGGHLYLDLLPRIVCRMRAQPCRSEEGTGRNGSKTGATILPYSRNVSKRRGPLGPAVRGYSSFWRIFRRILLRKHRSPVVP